MAVAEGYLWRNPAALLFTPRECRRAATRVMTVEEVRQLFSVLDVRERLIARLALLAGMRPGEIFGLKWARMEADLSRDRSSEGKGMQTFQFQTKKTIEEIRRPYHQQLGSNVCAAFISRQQGIKMDTASRKSKNRQAMSGCWYPRSSASSASREPVGSRLPFSRMPRLTRRSSSSPAAHLRGIRVLAHRWVNSGGDLMAIEINTDNIADAVAHRLRDNGVVTPRLLTLEQAATYLGLTKDALKAKVHMGRIPTVDLDKKLRFDRQDLDRIIEQNKRSA